MKSDLKNFIVFVRKALRLGFIALFEFMSLFSYSPVKAAEFFPEPGTMVLASSTFEPVLMRAIKVFPQDPFKFDFIIDRGTESYDSDRLKLESERMVKYFLTSLAIPEKDMWVNLSPYEQDRIIPDGFAATEMGKEVLAQDYILKQLAASLIHPDQESGKKFWEKIYEKTFEKYGTMDVPVETFHKVWIVPGKSSVFENADNNTTFVLNTELDVMLEEDYVAQQQSKVSRDVYDRNNPVSEEAKLSSEVMREVVIPVIREEVNHGEHFAPLRQVMNALVLATWYKQALKQSLLAQGYINQGKLDGIAVDDLNFKDQIYQNYLEAFRKGVFDFIKDEYDPVSQSVIPRKYFSGGVNATDIRKNMAMLDAAEPQVQQALSDMALLADQASDNAQLFYVNSGAKMAGVVSDRPDVKEAPVYKGETLPDRNIVPKKLSDHIFIWLQKKQGIASQHAQKMHEYAQRKGMFLIVRNMNAESLPYLNNPDMAPKHVISKAKTAKVGPNKGLVVNPFHPVQVQAWNEAIGDARRLNLQGKMYQLMDSRIEAEQAWNEHSKEMLENGYSVNSETGVVEYTERLSDGTFKFYSAIHPDYDGHGAYRVMEDGTIARVSFGAGRNFDANGHDLDGINFRRELNDAIGAGKDMFQHGFQDDWRPKDGNKPVYAVPPAVVFFPDGRQPRVLNSYQDMQNFYETVMGVKWRYSTATKYEKMKKQVALTRLLIRQTAWRAGMSFSKRAQAGRVARFKFSREVLRIAATLAFILLSATIINPVVTRANDSVTIESLREKNAGNVSQFLTTDSKDQYGGIDLEKVDVSVTRQGQGVKTAFEDPVQLENLKNATGLNPVVYDIKPLTPTVLNQLLGVL